MVELTILKDVLIDDFAVKGCWVGKGRRWTCHQ